MSRRRGIVKWFDDKKGYGFVRQEAGEDVFVHFSAIEALGFRSLFDGQEVELLEVVEDDRGRLKAARVVPL